MINENSRYERSRVLAVDDEPVALQNLAFQLSNLGHYPVVAGSASEAQEILTREGAGQFGCLITDCWMEDQSGLDLLCWLREYDPTLASIVTSGAADKAAITQTLRGGASDFLEKPVFRRELQSALQKAFESTERRRRHAATRSAVREAGLVQRRMNDLGIAAGSPVFLTTCYHPCHDAGGDSVAFFLLDKDRILVVVADVSGHDLKSAFLSAYFQGTLRAMVEQAVPISAVLDRFNRFLTREWGESSANTDDAGTEITSLSVCATSIDLKTGKVDILNSGFPHPTRIDVTGQTRLCGEAGGSPLGWVDPNPLQELSFITGGGEQLIIWTDGLEDLAHQLGIGKWCLAFAILQAKKEGRTPAWLADAPDDILMVLIGLTLKPAGQGGVKEQFGEGGHFPLMVESYRRAQRAEIDGLQNRWRKSLQFAFPRISPTRIADVVLCTREAVLNGLVHGCAGEFDECRLMMTLDGALGRLQVEVIDPGAGHSFDWRAHASDEMAEGHRGLLLMHRLSQHLEQDSSGAAVRMFFEMESGEQTAIAI